VIHLARKEGDEWDKRGTEGAGGEEVAAVATWDGVAGQGRAMGNDHGKETRWRRIRLEDKETDED
jgi:hypothetical protein